MSSRYYPAFLNVEGRRCLVIGNDREADEKSRRLADAGARVDVVASTFSEAFVDAARSRSIQLHRRPFEAADLQDQFLVILTVKDDPALTKRVAELCRRDRVLLCAIDQPAFCDVVNAALFDAGRLVVAIGTGGAAPALGSRIRKGLEELDRDRLARFVDDLAQLRLRLETEEPQSERRRERLKAAVAGFKFRAEVTYPDWWEKNEAI